MVKTERTINGVTSKEERFYISSIKNDIKLFSKAARKHWGVENSLHWCMKVSFRDDESRIRSGNAPINCVILKHISLNLLKQEKTLKRGIKGKKLVAAWSNDYLEKIIFGRSLIKNLSNSKLFQKPNIIFKKHSDIT